MAIVKEELGWNCICGITAYNIEGDGSFLCIIHAQLPSPPISFSISFHHAFWHWGILFKRNANFHCFERKKTSETWKKHATFTFSLCASHIKLSLFPYFQLTLSLSLSLISTLWIWNENEFPASLLYREFNYTTTKISFPSPITCIQQHKANVVSYFFIRSSFRRFFFAFFFLSLFRLQQF